MYIDFSNPWVFLVWYFVTVGLLFISYKTKKSILCLIPVIYFLVILGVHVFKPELIEDVVIHRIFNFIGLAVSLSFFVVMDEVETRRKFISQVFKNRYKKHKISDEVKDIEDYKEDETEEAEE